MGKIKYILLLLSLSTLYTIGIQAQTISIHHPLLKFLYEDSLLLRPDYHSALQPVKIYAPDRNDPVQTHGRASLCRASHSAAAPLTTPDSYRDDLLLTTKKYLISPVLDASGSYNFNSKTFSYRFAQGAYIASNLGKRAGFELSAVLYEQKFPGQSFSIDSLKLVPRHNRYLWGNNESAGYLAVRGNIWWKANKWLTFTAGNDKHFIGDGERSLFLSENAAAYPFFQTRLNIWKINYQHQVMFLRDLVSGAGSERFPKYVSQHTLSYNHKNRFNFYIFETVIWRKQDSVRHRGFDLTYMNPFVFYRPVEFNQGSPDNVLMGLGGKWRIFGKNYLYGQFLLDEFNFKYFSKNQGWWASKYGYQLGFKTYHIFKKYPSVFILEYNQVRPFTYSHSHSLQNYGYLKQSLTHPIGSNFRELKGIIRILSKRWLFKYEGTYTKYGTDPVGLNYGADIYKGQWTFSKYYGNKIAQGILHNILSGELNISRILVPSWRLTAFSSYNLSYVNISGNNSFQSQLQFGINTLLYE